jgi:uncharacterized DUF497 family protein
MIVGALYIQLNTLITWDEPNRLAHLDKHGMDFADIESGFDWGNRPYRLSKKRTLQSHRIDGRRACRDRFAALGTEAISIVSLRPAPNKERSL